MFWDTPLHSTQFSVANLKCVRTFCSVFESSMLKEFHNILKEKKEENHQRIRLVNFEDYIDFNFISFIRDT